MGLELRDHCLGQMMGRFLLAEEIKDLFQGSTLLSSSKVNNPVLKAGYRSGPFAEEYLETGISSQGLCSYYLYLQVYFRQDPHGHWGSDSKPSQTPS